LFDRRDARILRELCDAPSRRRFSVASPGVYTCIPVYLYPCTRSNMNTIVFNKLSSQVLFEEKAKEAEMSSRNYLEVMDGQHPDLLSGSQAMKDNAARHRRAG